MPTNIEQIKRSLAAAQARWQAKETPVSQLSDLDKKRILGATPSPSAEAELAAIKARPPQAPAPNFAPAVDWRNHNGNHVTAVKNQGGCGSCVSFGSVGMVESMAHIEGNIWLDLSEADSHFCSNHGANCGGWWPDQCLDEIIARGVCDEAGFPYPSAFPNNDIWQGPPVCHLPPNRRPYMVNARRALADSVSIKNYLTDTGPVVGCFTVYDDFFNYSNGVYHHVTGSVAGGHCVLIIGYSEAEACWIFKNSWDTTWGMSGFCKFAYGDFLFNGSLYPMYGVTGVIMPQ